MKSLKESLLDNWKDIEKKMDDEVEFQNTIFGKFGIYKIKIVGSKSRALVNLGNISTEDCIEMLYNAFKTRELEKVPNVIYDKIQFDKISRKFADQIYSIVGLILKLYDQFDENDVQKNLYKFLKSKSNYFMYTNKHDKANYLTLNYSFSGNDYTNYSITLTMYY